MGQSFYHNGVIMSNDFANNERKKNKENHKSKPKKYADEKFKHKEVINFKKHKMEEDEDDWDYWKEYYK